MRHVVATSVFMHPRPQVDAGGDSRSRASSRVRQRAGPLARGVGTSGRTSNPLSSIILIAAAGVSGRGSAGTGDDAGGAGRSLRQGSGRHRSCGRRASWRCRCCGRGESCCFCGSDWLWVWRSGKTFAVSASIRRRSAPGIDIRQQSAPPPRRRRCRQAERTFEPASAGIKAASSSGEAAAPGRQAATAGRSEAAAACGQAAATTTTTASEQAPTAAPSRKAATSAAPAPALGFTCLSLHPGRPVTNTSTTGVGVCGGLSLLYKDARPARMTQGLPAMHRCCVC